MPLTNLSRPWRSAPHSTARGAVLLIHGFTGTPQSMRPWAEHLVARGWEVDVPLLPGHGSSWQKMAHSRWQQWYDVVRESVADLQERHGRIAVLGQSMGGTLALAAAQDPRVAPGITALGLVNPLVLDAPVWAVARALSPVVPSVPGIASDIRRDGVREEAYDRTPLRAVAELRSLTRIVRRGLGEVTAPMVLATSCVDHTVPPRNSDVIASSVRGDVDRLPLPNSYHLATLDHDAPTLFSYTAGFLSRMLPATAGGETG